MLLIEPDRADAEALTATIDAHFGGGGVIHTRTLTEALGCDLGRIDLVISEAALPDADGVKVVEELLLEHPALPIVILAKGEALAESSAALREGAYDYLVKADGYLHTIPAAIEKNLAMHRVKQDNARLQVQLTATLGQLRSRNQQLTELVQELETIAATDALTGIANRRAVTQGLDQRFAHAVRSDTDLAIIALDLDGFKALNDNAGHPAGDRVLMLVARVLSANARSSDVPGRIGGDEFIVVLPGTGPDEAARVAQRVYDDFNLAYADLADRLGYAGPLTISAGVATRQQVRAQGVPALLAAADRALYRAKDAGRACVVLHGEPI